jgi:hypothetical protein
MELQKSPTFDSLPASVRESLIDCVSESQFDAARFNALVGEHHVGLSAQRRKRLLEDAYDRYAARHPEPAE